MADEIYTEAGGVFTSSYCLIPAAWSGTGNIDSDPLFVDAASGNLCLQAGSACIDAADGDVAPDMDILGNPRNDDPGMDNIGAGTPGYTDIGAYEYQDTTTWCTVPDVLNRSENVASAMIVSAGLAVGLQSYEYSQTVPVDYVIQQNPSAGQLLASGSAIDLVISKGPSIEEVPDVTGKTLSEAELMIMTSNLIVDEVTYSFNETMPKEHVITQSAMAGSNVPSGSPVDLEASFGRPDPDNYEGCTPGFWKNHPSCWNIAYNKDMLISDVFVALISAPYDILDDGDRKSDFDTDTMLVALRYRGGSNLAGSVRNMLRHATAALLNANNNNVGYPIPDSLVIDLVNHVLNQQDIDQIQELHVILKDLNENSPCPINAHGKRSGDTARRRKSWI